MDRRKKRSGSGAEARSRLLFALPQAIPPPTQRNLRGGAGGVNQGPKHVLPEALTPPLARRTVRV